MYAVALEKPEQITAISEDDDLADLIKTITPEEAKALWVTLIQLNPKLADL
jgi:hypothetical protein